jgi:predicted  nucleic acid-binding Zn-ribbon protein
MKTTLPVLLGCLVFSIPAIAQHHADLTPAEVDQLRDTAMEPNQRLKFYLNFARERLAKLDQVRADPKLTPDQRASATHDRLQDFLDLYDELNDNIDTYNDRNDDIRKPLKNVIEADAEFQNKLNALQDSVRASGENSRPYDFVLSNAIDTLTESAKDHRELLQDQEEAAKHKKIKKQE